jgi:hypothetical protein
VFGSVVVVVFQRVFRSKIYQNIIFFYLKKLFLTKAHQNDPKNIKKIKFKQKNSIFLEISYPVAFPKFKTHKI